MPDNGKTRAFLLVDKKVFKRQNERQLEPKDKVNPKTRKQIFRLSQKKE